MAFITKKIKDDSRSALSAAATVGGRQRTAYATVFLFLLLCVSVGGLSCCSACSVRFIYIIYVISHMSSHVSLPFMAFIIIRRWVFGCHCHRHCATQASFGRRVNSWGQLGENARNFLFSLYIHNLHSLHTRQLYITHKLQITNLYVKLHYKELYERVKPTAASQ